MMELFCPSCEQIFFVAENVCETECPNENCREPYRFKVFAEEGLELQEAKQLATTFLDNVRSDSTRKFMFQISIQPASIWVVAYLEKQTTEDRRRSSVLSRIAHSLSLPVQSIIADSSLILDGISKDDPNYEIAEHLHSEIRALQLLVENILHAEGQRTAKPDIVFVQRSVSLPLIEACEMFKGEAAEKGCDIRFISDVSGNVTCSQWAEIAKQHVPVIEIHVASLVLAFKNLVHNAVKYSYRSTNCESNRYIDVVCRMVNDLYCEILLQNYGVGIMPEEIDKGLIWKPGYRGSLSLDRNRTGTGLGLAHVKWAIEVVHGGIVEARSTKAGGAYITTFKITLPKSQSHRITKETDVG